MADENNGEMSELEEITEKAREDAENVNAIKIETAVAADAAAASQKEAASAANTASTNANETVAILAQAKTNFDETNALITQVKTNTTELLGLLEKARTDSAATAEIARTANEKDTRVDEYEQELQALKNNYDDIREKIEALLPAATGTGLAKAFNTRKKAFEPRLRWSFVAFVISILGFIAFGIWAFLEGDIDSVQKFFVFAFERSPVIVGLILLEEFSRRLYHNTLKLEEDYAFKETLSTAFDGYKKAMTEIGSSPQETLAKTFSINVLDVLNARPGRLYETEKEESLGSLITALQPEGGGSKEKLVLKFYEDLKHQLKGWGIKVLLIIALAIAVGLGVGYYFGKNSPQEKMEAPSIQRQQP